MEKLNQQYAPELTTRLRHVITEVDGNDDLDSTGFEVSYTYAINDNVTITPGFFTVEDTSAGDDDSGIVVETAFSF